MPPPYEKLGKRIIWHRKLSEVNLASGLHSLPGEGNVLCACSRHASSYLGSDLHGLPGEGKPLV